jgi:hypothetical protein
MHCLTCIEIWKVQGSKVKKEQHGAVSDIMGLNKVLLFFIATIFEMFLIVDIHILFL